MDTCIIDTCIIDTCIMGICIVHTCITRNKDKEEDKEVNLTWVTRPERTKVAKDEVKQAQ